MQGDRVSGARKPAELETGKIVQVPLFINTGDRVQRRHEDRRVHHSRVMTRSDPGRPDRRSDARERALYLLYEATQKGVSVDEVLAAQVVPADDLTTVARHRRRRPP